MTAAQRALLDRMAVIASDHMVSRGEALCIMSVDSSVVDALRAALGTCGNCAHLRDGLCLTDDHDHPSAQSGRPLAITRPEWFGCTGWTAKEGA